MEPHLPFPYLELQKKFFCVIMGLVPNYLLLFRKLEIDFLTNNKENGGALMLKFHRSSLVFKWTCSFLIVLLIPIVFNYITYQYLIHNIRQEVNQKNNLFYQNIQRQIDLELERYNTITPSLISNPQILTISKLTDISTATPDMIAGFQDALKPYSLMLYTAYKSYFYFDSSSSVGGTNGLQDSMEFFNSVYSGLNIDYETWKEWVISPYEDVKIVTGTSTLTDVAPKYIMFKFRLISNNTSMIVVIRDSYFLYQIGKIVEDSSIDYEIFDKFDTLLATSLSSDGLTTSVPERLTQSQGIFELKLDGIDTVVNYVSSLTNGWRYVFYTPKAHYYASSNSFYVMSLLMFAAVVLGLGVIRFLVDRQYSPIKKLLAIAPSKGKAENEYSQIEGLILEAAQQLRQTKTIQEKHRRHEKDAFWVKLLNGTLSEIQPETVKKYLTPDFSSYPNVVVLIPMNHYGELFKDENISDFERYNLLIDVIDNIGRELLENQGMDSYFFESYGNCIALISVPKQQEMVQLNEVLSEFLSLMKQHFSVELSAGVSDWHQEIYALTKAYTEAFSCIDYIQYTEESDIVFYEDIVKEHTNTFSFTVERINQLCTYIKYGESEKACTFIDDLIYRFTHSVDFEPTVFRYYIRDIINTITKNFQNYVSSDNKRVNDLYLLTLANSTDVHSIESALHELISGICDKINKETQATKDNSTASLAQKIKTYIDQHYTDPDLSANMVAQEFHISAPYISKLFKSIQPEGFVNYINTLRIEKAKELLRCTSKKIEDISTETGFLNTTSFIRLFKKTVGTTPGSYRKAES